MKRKAFRYNSQETEPMRRTLWSQIPLYYLSRECMEQQASMHDKSAGLLNKGIINFLSSMATAISTFLTRLSIKIKKKSSTLYGKTREYISIVKSKGSTLIN